MKQTRRSFLRFLGNVAAVAGISSCVPGTAAAALSAVKPKTQKNPFKYGTLAYRRENKRLAPIGAKEILDYAPVERVGKAVWVGEGGDVSLTMGNGGAMTFYGVASGSLLPVRTVRINDKGTTAKKIKTVY